METTCRTALLNRTPEENKFKPVKLTNQSENHGEIEVVVSTVI